MTTQPAPSIAQATWRIDPTRSRVEFQVPHFWGLATVTGRFSRYHGTLRLSGTPAVELIVEAGGLDTRNRRRDAHLRSPAFFDAERHPRIRFASDNATLDGERLAARGALYARGASIPLGIDATLRRAGEEIEVEAVAEADHRALGMTWNWLGMIRSPSRLVVHARLVRDA